MSNTDDLSPSCSLCEDLLEESSVFCCKTCESDDAKTILCKFCIVQHSKRKHSITDFAGRKLVLCPEHKNVRAMYCRPCDESFCVDCWGNHGGHETETLESNCKKSRVKIFEYLEEFDTLDKRMRARMDETLFVFKEREDNTDRYSIKSMRNELLKDVHKYVDENLSQKVAAMTAFESFSSLIDQSDALNVDMRSLLSLSDSFQAERFTELCSKLDESIASQKRQLMHHFSMKPLIAGHLFMENPNFKAQLDQVLTKTSPAYLLGIETPKSCEVADELPDPLGCKDNDAFLCIASSFVAKYSETPSKNTTSVSLWNVQKLSGDPVDTFELANIPFQSVKRIDVSHKNVSQVFFHLEAGFFIQRYSDYRNAYPVLPTLSNNSKIVHFLDYYQNFDFLTFEETESEYYQNFVFLTFEETESEKRLTYFSNNQAVCSFICTEEPVFLTSSCGCIVAARNANNSSIRVFDISRKRDYTLDELTLGLQRVDHMQFVDEQLLLFEKSTGILLRCGPGTSTDHNGYIVNWEIKKAVKLSMNASRIQDISALALTPTVIISYINGWHNCVEYLCCKKGSPYTPFDEKNPMRSGCCNLSGTFKTLVIDSQLCRYVSCHHMTSN